jgi:signal peptidase I
MSRRKFALGMIVVVAALTSSIVSSQVVGSSVEFGGYSMAPTIWPKERLEIQKTNAYLRGDIVLFPSPKSAVAIRPGVKFIKRIVALAGDRLKMVKGQVFVNSKLLDEIHTIPYWKAKDNLDTDSELTNSRDWYFRLSVPKTEDFLVPSGTVFVLGDNRSIGGSEDSRVFGPVPLETIEGKAIAVVGPSQAQMKLFKVRASGGKELTWWEPAKDSYGNQVDPKNPGLLRDPRRKLETPEAFAVLNGNK